MKHTIKIILILLLFMLASCTGPLTDTRPKMSTTVDKLELKVGEIEKLQIDLVNINNPTYEFSYSKDGIVEVDEQLNVHALKEGTVIVTVSIKDSIVDPIDLEIKVLKGIDFEIIGNNFLKVTNEAEYMTTLLTDKDVIWLVEDDEILKVEGNKVTALKEGTTFLTATYKGITKKLEITVIPYFNTGIEYYIIGPTSLGVSGKATYSVSFVDDVEFNWTVDNSEILKVEGNEVTALKEGTATLTAEYLNLKVEIIITVYKDDEKPVITYSGKDSIIINWNDMDALLKDVTAIDNIDGDISSKIKIQDGFDIQKYGVQEVTYEVTDSAGNKSTISRTVEVIWNNQVSFIGHAGSYYGLMNSEEAILYAIEVLKYQYVEIDLKQTSDGVFVLCHDDTFGGYTISQTPWSVLKDVEVTQSRNAGYPSQNGSVTNSPYTSKICSLERFLDICKTNNVRPVIELKSSKGITNTDQSRMQALMNVIEAFNMLEDIVFLGSQYNCLIWTRLNGYEMVECQYLVNSCESETYLNRCIEYDLDISINVTGTYSNSDAWLAKYKEAGLKISTYTYTQYVNYDVVQAWIDKGVDFVTCDWQRMDKLRLPVNTGEIGVKHKVTFKDVDGTILKETTVEDGKTAAAPSDPKKLGYKFIGWDKSLSNITEDTVFTACFEEIIYNITYVSNLEEVIESSFGTKEEFINGLYTDLFNWIKENSSNIKGLSLSGNTYKLTRNGTTVTFGSVEDILAIDIYDFELTISNILFKPLTRNSDGTATILEDENYFFNSSKYRIKYKGIDAWLYNAIVNSYDWYDTTYTPTSSGKIQIFFRMHQWAKGGNVPVFNTLPKKYELVTNNESIKLPTDVISYTINDEILLSSATSNYEFAGWYDNPDYSGNAISKIEKGSTGDLVLYAKWNKE